MTPSTPFTDAYPDLAAQYHDDNEKPLHEVTAGMRYKALWFCGKPGHLWRASVFNRTAAASTGCPVCSGRKVIAGINDLATTHPQIAARWSPDNPVPPTQITAHSHVRVTLVCEHAHTWSKPVTEATTTGGRCPGCRSLAFLRPDLAAELVDPADGAKGAAGSTPLRWRCTQGHTWKATTDSRNRQGTGCPFCVGKRAVPGVTDAATLYPELAEQTTVDLSELRPGSAVRVPWRCERGHTWEQTLASRALQGTGCPVCSGRVAEPGVNDLATTLPNLAAQWSPENDRPPTQVSIGSDFVALWVCDRHGTWSMPVKKRGLSGQGCPSCAANTFSSRGENEVADFVASLTDEPILRNHRHLPGVSEVDIYLPERSLAIEFNGVFWHSEKAGVERLDHQRKLRALDSLGIRLLVVWEDDWRTRRTVVESLLRSKLGVSQQPRIGARETVIDTAVAPNVAEVFLVRNHLQGPARATLRYGLRNPEDGSLVALMCLTRRGKSLYLDRYATACRVPGGFTRLLAVAANYGDEHGLSEIVTFADRTVSDGGVYRDAGFRHDGDLAPDYSYVKGQRRHHKFGYRLSRFRNDPDLEYRDGLTERELAALNGLHRVWDYGKQRWVYPLT